MNDKYNTLKNALIIERNDRLLKEYEKLMIEMDRKDNDEYLDSYNKYDYMSLTVEDEEERLSNIINLIKEREEKQKEFRDDYKYITGEEADFLIDILDVDKLEDLEKRLDIVKHYLSVKERIVNLSLNIKEYNKELKVNPSNKRLNTKLNKSTKKIHGLLNSLRKDNILELLYEFCIVDSYHDEDIDNTVMLKNILSTKIKKKDNKKELGDNRDNKEENIEIKSKDSSSKKSINISDASIFIIPGDKLEVVDDKDVSKKNVEEYIEDNNKIENSDKEKEEDIVVITNDNKDEEEKVLEEETESNTVEEDSNDNYIEIEDDYVKEMVPIDMLKIDKIGTVKPVTIMDKLEKAQEEEGDLVIPSMGVLDKNNDLNIDSNDFLKNSTKNDKIS